MIFDDDDLSSEDEGTSQNLPQNIPPDNQQFNLQLEFAMRQVLRHDKQLARKYRAAKLLNDETLIKLVESKIQRKMMDYIDSGGTILPSSPLIKKQSGYEGFPGEYAMGDTIVGLHPEANIYVKLYLEELSGHVLIAGATGRGKTTILLNILDQVQKRSSETRLRYLVLASKRYSEQRSLIINNQPGTALFFDIKNLRFNPFFPVDGASNDTILSDTARVIASETSLQLSGQLSLRKYISVFLQQHPRGNLKTFYHWLEDYRPGGKETFQEIDTKNRLLLRLGELINEAGNIFECVKGISEYDLVSNNIIIELPTSSPFIRSLLGSLLSWRILRLKESNPQLRDRFKNLIIFEDIQSGVQERDMSFGGESSFFRLVEESRINGMNIFFNVQTVAEIPSRLIGNISVIICKQLFGPDDARRITRMLNFNEETDKRLTMMLRVNQGVFIDKTRGALPVPFNNPDYPAYHVGDDEIHSFQSNFIRDILSKVILKVPSAPPSEAETSKQAKEQPPDAQRKPPEKTLSPEPILKPKPTIAQPEQAYSEPVPKRDVVPQKVEPEIKQQPPGNDFKDLGYDLTLLLKDIGVHAFDFQKERELRLNMNVKLISQNLNILVDKDYLVRDDKINLGKGRGQFQPYLYTKLAESSFGKQTLSGKGSIAHRFWQYRTARFFAGKKYNVSVEHYLDDRKRSIDILAVRDNLRVSIEIELNDTLHIKDNITKCIEFGSDKIYFLTYSSKLKKRIEKLALSIPEAKAMMNEGKLVVDLLSSIL